MTTSWIHNKHIPLLCILPLTVVVFSPTFGNGFQMEWDDQWMVHNPLTESRLDWAIIKAIWAYPFNGQFGPINQMLYNALFQLDGYNPTVFHCASLLLHIINIIVVYILSNKINSDVLLLNKADGLLFTSCVTFLFAVHPLQVETIAWISASKILLSATFLLLSSYFLILFLKKGNNFGYIVSLMLFLMAYYSKEQALSFPFAATILCICYGFGYKTSRFWIVLFPLYITAFVLGLHLIYRVASYDEFMAADLYPFWQRIIFSCYSLLKYCALWLCPINLSWAYPYPNHIGEPLPSYLTLLPFVIVTCFFTFKNILLDKKILTCLLFFTANMIFVLHITILPRFAVVADRYMYLPILGLNAIFAFSLLSLKKYCKFSHIVIIFMMIIVSCMGVSFMRTMDWDNSEKLRRNNVQQLI